MVRIPKSEINYYVDKFLRKMNGCKKHEAKDWTLGIGYPEAECLKVWSVILSHPETTFAS